MKRSVVSILAAAFLIVGQLFVIGITVSVPYGSASQGDDSQVERVIAAHRSGREAIQSLQADFKIERVFPRQKVMVAGRYMRQRGSVLIRSGSEDQADGTILVKDGEARAVARTWRPDKTLQYGATRAPASRTIGGGDIWQKLLFTHVNLSQESLPFEEYVKAANGATRVITRVEQGHEVTVVKITVGSKEKERLREFSFDPSVNYLIRRTSSSPPDSGYIVTNEVVEFKEARPGVFVPVKVRYQNKTGNTLEDEVVSELSNVVVNEPISQDRFSLPSVPPGTIVTDRGKQIEYPIDANWNRIGPAREATVLKHGGPSVESVNYQTQSESEPRSYIFYLLATSAALLVLVALIWLIRVRRRRVRVD